MSVLPAPEGRFPQRLAQDIIDFAFVQLFTIFLQRARIAHQIVRPVKLHRVDENADDHHICPGFCLIDQLHMAVVQVAHGGNQCDAFAFLTQTANMLAQQRQGSMINTTRLLELLDDPARWRCAYQAYIR